MYVTYEVRDAVAVITLDRPDKLNAPTPEMREALGSWNRWASRHWPHPVQASRGRGGVADSQVELAPLLEHLRQMVGAVKVPLNADFRGGFARDPERVGVNVNAAQPE